MITDANKKKVVDERIFQLPQKPGIFKLNIPPEKSPPLQVGKKYFWGVQILCIDELGDRSCSPIVESIIQPIEPE